MYLFKLFFYTLYVLISQPKCLSPIVIPKMIDFVALQLILLSFSEIKLVWNWNCLTIKSDLLIRPRPVHMPETRKVRTEINSRSRSVLFLSEAVPYFRKRDFSNLQLPSCCPVFSRQPNNKQMTNI